MILRLNVAMTWRYLKPQSPKRRSRFCVLAYVVSLLLTTLSTAWLAHGEEAAADLVARIQQEYDRIQSLRAEFVQETKSETASLGTSARGTLYFLKPRAMRWEYEEPRQWFLVLEDRTWHYVPEDMTIYEQAISTPEVFNLFSGLDRVAQTFSISQLPDEPGSLKQHRLELLPRKPEFPVSRVRLWIDPESYLVVRVQTEDPLGNVNQITLDQIQVNPPLDPSLFRLEVPEGVTVERQEASPQE